MLAIVTVTGHICKSNYCSCPWWSLKPGLVDIPRRSHYTLDAAPLWLAWTCTTARLWTWSEVFVMLCNPQRRALPDLIAGTVLVKAAADSASAFESQPEPLGLREWTRI